MPRVKRGTKRRARRKKLLKHAKGFFLTKGKLFRSAKEAVNRSLRYTYRDRRTRKRDYRTLWIQRIGAAARANGTDLQPVDPRIESGRDRRRPEDHGGYGRARRRRIYVARGSGEAAYEGRVCTEAARGVDRFPFAAKLSCEASHLYEPRVGHPKNQEMAAAPPARSPSILPLDDDRSHNTDARAAWRHDARKSGGALRRSARTL